MGQPAIVVRECSLAPACQWGSGGAFHGPDLVRRAHVRECAKHITVRPYLISLHLSIGQDGHEEGYDVVGE